MEKRRASVVLPVEECKAGLRKSIRRIEALVLIVGLFWPAALRAGASEIDSSAVNVERMPVVAPSLQAATSDSTQIDSSRVSRGFQEVSAGSMEDIGTGKRIVDKLISGATVSFIGGFAGVVLEGPFGSGYSGYSARTAAVFGAALGVSKADPHDRLIMSLGGSVLGLGIALKSQGMPWPSFFVGPVAFATLASELWRKPPASRRFSVGLVPAPKRGLSAVATLRF